MKISVSTLTIAIDALRGSLQIADGGRIFSYTKESRQNAVDILTEVVRQISVTIDAEDSEKK